MVVLFSSPLPFWDRFCSLFVWVKEAPLLLSAPFQFSLCRLFPCSCLYHYLGAEAGCCFVPASEAVTSGGVGVLCAVDGGDERQEAVGQVGILLRCPLWVRGVASSARSEGVSFAEWRVYRTLEDECIVR